MNLTKDHSKQIKGAAILCMVLFHLFGFPERIPTSAWWMGMPIIKALQICVPIYLFMAGYGLQSAAIKGEVTWRIIGKRLKKLYLSFWWVAVPFITIGCIIGYYTFTVETVFYNLLGLTASCNGEWWFFSLYTELLVLFYFISKIKLSWKSYLLLMLGLLIFTRALNGVLRLDDGIIVERHLKMVLIDLNVFMLGCFFAKFDIFEWLNEQYFWLYKKTWLAPLFILIPILVRAYLPLIGITELLIVPIFCIGIVNICKTGGGKILFFFGKYSTNLWLIHSFFIFYFLNGISFVTNNPLVIFITVLGCSLTCSIIIEFMKSKIHI
ncbi:acyltransferase [Bacteroides ovatus]|uniref:acyltransferase family protein n=1 Tax=Bacteroides ovatus TaxID=28116 RepID=UPI002954DAB3|nr:acyltransferase [Bacteroides ovatus]MDV7055150.1 acyltransferase [Bacteroides ovatus]